MDLHSPVARGLIVSVVVFVISVVALIAMAQAPKASAAAPPRERSERLDALREIAGVPCVTRVVYDADGRLRTCTLGRATTFARGLTLPAGAQVTLDAQARPEMTFLPANTVLDGHVCAGTGTHDAMTTFYPNGRLRFCNLASPEMIQGIPCQRSTFWIWVTQGGAGTYFHDNGTLHRCLLADDVTVGGRVFKKRDHLTLDRDGTPAS